ncbi:AI-2E family transporter [Winogradskyella bathintestinalis]|uniref:AI-2E family transporter n=1 Tax=Winogradskyella bathintestinalis TaxID=3035208 RepID=A0ABT7ZQR2_9FLAO|nr:AI-2E family transporter [Winogradskyella bathintestinalis]MDN3491340.1 AI-2E family transporter [Winogradskyella bathintestinalis]
MSTEKIEISALNLIKILLLSGGILVLLYYGKDIIMPLLVAAIISILLDTPVQKFKSLGLPNWLSITLAVLLMLVVFSLLFWLISSQINNMAQDWPTIKDKATDKLNSFSQWANDRLNWDYKDYIENNKKLVEKAESLASIFLASLMSLLSQSLIIFVYIILFLMQKLQFVNFFKKLFSNQTAINSLLKNSAKITRNYFVGKGKIMLFLFVIYYVGFLIGSVPYALFLALFAALFSIIPYVGNVIGGGVAVILSYLYAGSTPALIVIGVVSATQIIENYVLTPWIIGDEINLNPFMTIFGIILFSSLWGVVGAIISLPLIGVLKVIFDHTKGMAPYAYLFEKTD